MAYLYRHIRLDKNKPFYIGIGSDDNYKRAFGKTSRTKHWKNIVNSTEYEVEIMLDDLTWEQACEKEKEFIALYGRKDKDCGTLCNYTDGGEGAYGRILSVQSKEKISFSVSGNKHGMYGKKHSTLAKKKISKANFKKVINIKTGVVYESVLEAAKVYNLRANTLSRKLSGIRFNNTDLKYL